MGVLGISLSCRFWSWGGPVERVHDVVQLRALGSPVASLIFLAAYCKEDEEDEDNGER